MQSLTIEETPRLNKKILLVDDYPPTRQLIRDALNQTGYTDVDEAENGREALDKFGDNQFDLVISDVMMPGMGGMELLNQLREISPDTSVIMITAYPAEELTVSAMKKGAVDFLKKPFNIDDLLYKIDIYLNEKTILHNSQDTFNVSEIQIKDKTKELSVQGYIYDSFENIEGDNDYVFNKIVDLSLKVVEGEECSLLLFDEEEKTFHPKVVRSLNPERYESETIPALKQIFNEVVERKEALVINSTEHFEIAPSLICAPMMIRGNIFGILCIRKKMHRELFTSKDLHYIVSLAKRASLNIENRILYESIYNNVLDTFRSLIASIQLRDHYTEEHSFRVTQTAVKIAEAMSCSQQEIESLKIAGLLHDVGKIAIPDNVLLKPDRLTYEEYGIIKTHPDVGEQILKPLLLFERERSIILCHHERWDGKGYPSGLTGSEIPFLARILSVADSFDAMTNNRPYRSAMDVDRALGELKKNRNTQFDGQVVDAFLKIL
ncbi:MAG: response regulator [Deltaproteobacteria bacterium]|nr:response regulator [Deltaproteobacteria bacterium]